MNGIVIAHGGAKEIFDYHATSWKKYLKNIQVISPEDDPINDEDYVCHSLGKSEHSGYDTCKRLQYACELASKNKGPTAIIEYDVILFDKLPKPEENEFLGCEKRKDGQTFVSDWYSHAPWIMTAKTAHSIATYKLSESLYGAKFCDRWLAAVCDRLGIIHREIDFSYSPHGGNANNNDEKYKMICAINRGAKYIHGNKDIELSKMLTKINNA